MKKWKILKGDAQDLQDELNELQKVFDIEIYGVTQGKYDMVIVITLAHLRWTELDKKRTMGNTKGFN
jgi:hypothetical protein